MKGVEQITEELVGRSRKLKEDLEIARAAARLREKEESEARRSTDEGSSRSAASRRGRVEFDGGEDSYISPEEELNNYWRNPSKRSETNSDE